MTTTPKLKTYTKKEAGAYLVSLAGQNILYNIIGAALGYFLQFTILVPAMTVSVIMMIARAWDAFNDPIMGTLVDRTRTRWGKCRPYLIIVPIPIMILTIACFTNFGFYGQGAKALDTLIVGWAAFTYIIWSMAYTVGDIPLWGVTALMTEDANDRNKLLSVARIAAGIGGGLSLLTIQPLALAIAGWLAPLTETPAIAEKYGFLISAAFFALIGSGLFQICGFVIKERIAVSEKKPTLKENFIIMWKNKPFRQILLSGILGSPKMLIALSAMPLVTYYFASKSPILALLYLALLGGGMFAGQFVAMAFVPALLKKFSKKNLYNFSHIIMVVPFILVFVVYLIAPMNLTSPIALAVCFVLFAILGGGNGITTVLQSLMIADAVDYQEYHFGNRPDGVFFSGQTFIVKLSGAIATIISGIGYSIVGFSDARVAEVNAFIAAGGIARTAPQYKPFMMILFFLVSIPPAIGCLLGIIPTWKYSLDDDEHKRLLDELNIRRHARDEAAALAEAAEIEEIASETAD